MRSGIIYKITNKTNGKCYIGQTATSTKRRWSQHLYNAKRKKSKCVILENAIRKHGAENFTIEAIYICSIKDLNSAETRIINDHQSTNIKFGYNIWEGGGGSIGRSVSNDHRKKISNANKKSDVEEINIQERKLNGILVGYVVSKNNNNVRYTKNFANTKNSVEKNLELVKSWLSDLNSGKTVDTNRYNRTIDLPKNISYNYTNKKKRQGYNVTVNDTLNLSH